MRAAIDLKLASRNLLRHRRRTLFIGVALGFVTALVVLLQGLTSGIAETMLNSATALSTGHLNVGGFFKINPGQSSPVVTEYQKVLAVVRKELPEMAFAVQRGRGWAKVVSDSGSVQGGINGLDILADPALNRVLEIASGNINDLAQPRTALLFESTLKKLDVKVGDVVTISAQTTRGVSNTVDCRIVAIARDIGLLSQNSVFVPMETLRALYQLRSDTTGAIHIHLRPGDVGRVGELSARLRVALARAGYGIMDPDPRPFWMKFQTVNREDWTGQKLDVTTWEDELSYMTWTLQLLRTLSAVLVTILLSVVCIGIMNTMWIAIRERTREVGALRAIGMHRGSVLRMFLFESLLLGVGAAAVGVTVGAVMAACVNAAPPHIPPGAQLFVMSDHLRLAVHGSSMVGAMLLITVVSGMAAIFPALRAARLRPIVAMSHFG